MRRLLLIGICITFLLIGSVRAEDCSPAPYNKLKIETGIADRFEQERINGTVYGTADLNYNGEMDQEEIETFVRFDDKYLSNRNYKETELVYVLAHANGYYPEMCQFQLPYVEESEDGIFHAQDLELIKKSNNISISAHVPSNILSGSRSDFNIRITNEELGTSFGNDPIPHWFLPFSYYYPAIVLHIPEKYENNIVLIDPSYHQVRFDFRDSTVAFDSYYYTFPDLLNRPAKYDDGTKALYELNIDFDYLDGEFQIYLSIIDSILLNGSPINLPTMIDEPFIKFNGTELTMNKSAYAVDVSDDLKHRSYPADFEKAYPIIDGPDPFPNNPIPPFENGLWLFSPDPVLEISSWAIIIELFIAYKLISKKRNKQ